MMTIIGIDEAGRSPVIGPLIQSAVKAPSDHKVRELIDLGIFKIDSKMLSKKERAEKTMEIMGLFEVESIVWQPPVIDDYMRRIDSNMNLMEAHGIGMLGKRLKTEIIQVHRIQRSGVGAPRGGQSSRSIALIRGSRYMITRVRRPWSRRRASSRRMFGMTG